MSTCPECERPAILIRPRPGTWPHDVRLLRAYRKSLRLAKEQRRRFRSQVSADDQRLRDAADKAGVTYVGCDTPDWMAEEILGNRALFSDLLAFVEAVEWSAQDSYGLVCPVCGGAHPESRAKVYRPATVGHRPDCALDAARKQLQRWEGPNG